MQILSFAGSLRRESNNKKLAREATRLLTVHSLAHAEYLDLRDYPMPVYDGDLERDAGLPASVTSLAGKIAAVDALIVATPEYNGSISSVLKNAIDWLSRVRPMPLAGKHLLLMSASPGGWGGIRGLWHSRIPFEALGVHVFPDMLALSAATTAFDERGHLVAERAPQLQKLLTAFASHAAARLALRAA